MVWRLNVVRKQEVYKAFVDTLHCALEIGADLYVNERQKIRHYRARSIEERRRGRRRRKKKKNDFFTSRGAYVNLRYIAMLYIHSFDWKSVVDHDGCV